MLVNSASTAVRDHWPDRPQGPFRVNHPSHSHREDFDQILERLCATAEEGGSTGTRARRAGAAFDHQLRRILEGVTGAHPEKGYVAPSILNRIYDRAASASPAPRLPPSEYELVVAELGITEDLSADDLHRVRRRFARENHPDRVPPSRRDRATLRMSIANMLIDQALKARPARR